MFVRYFYRITLLGMKSLLLRKSRAFLTMLGMIFGVCSVITMLAIGEGASSESQEAIRRLGSSNIIIRSVDPMLNQPAGRIPPPPTYGINFEDPERILETIPSVKRIVPTRILRETLRNGANSAVGQVVGTYPNLLEVNGLQLTKGRFLTDYDEAARANVCVVGEGLARRLFIYDEPLDGVVRAGPNYYPVVGVVKVPQSDAPTNGKVGSAPPAAQSLDNLIYVPLSTARSRFRETRVPLDELTVEVRDVSLVETVVPQIEALLSRFHPQRDYEIVVPLELMRQAERTKRIFNIVLGSIAGISLLVSGLGIMNIMLATVTERTREIGIRRALGARQRDITIQFLVETMVLSVGGGILGVLLGLCLPVAVGKLTDLQAIVTLSSVLLSFGISALIGIVFGIYPASRAARLDPIEALRHG